MALRQRVLSGAAAVSRPTRIRWQAWRHQRFLTGVLANPALCSSVAAGQLPSAFGKGLSERAVEYPWTLGHRIHGDVLDAGGTFNHAFVLAATPATVRHVQVVTLAPEPMLPDHRVSYMWADLREIPVDDGSFDVIACLSTLEHVGMNNRGYGADQLAAPDPAAECLRVMREFRRIIRPGGTVLISVPYGAPTSKPFMRQIAEAELRAWCDVFGPSDARLDVFAYGRSGWALSSPDAARHACYRDRSNDLLAHDRAAAARAVACLALRK